MNQSTELTWTIRVAKETDIDNLIEMRLELQKHIEERNPNIWRMSSECHEHLKEQMIQNLRDRDVCILVAVNINDDIIGMAVGTIGFNRFRIPSTIAGIENVFVVKELRRKGIGTSLVRKLCQFFASRDVKEISVKYVVGNEDAMCFWKKNGLQPRIITSGINLHDLKSRIDL